MKQSHFFLAGLLTISMAACHKEKDDRKNTPPVVLPSNQPIPPPAVALGLNGELTTASVGWVLPKYLDGQFKDLGRADAEAALDLDLTKGDEKKAAHVNTGFSVKFCDPVAEAAEFVSNVPVAVAENFPESHKTDIDEIASWSAESQNFKGRAYLKKRYKSEGDTGVYRMDVLLANQKTSECVLWNFTFTPAKGMSAEFIEDSSEYQQLTEGLAATWKGIGADFKD
jgi:hypothetical protein